MDKSLSSADISLVVSCRFLGHPVHWKVLREQPVKIFEFIANYLSVLLITREHGILATKILDDLCDCKPSLLEHLKQLGLERDQAETLAQIIHEEIEEFHPVEGKEKIKETQILKKILTRSVLDEDMAAQVCQVARNAYRDYWYKKKQLEESLKTQPDEPWEIAAQHTLELYKKTKPSFSELSRATEKIQAAYRGYHVRKNVLRRLATKKKKMKPKVDLLGPPVDIAESREIDLGPILDVEVKEDDVNAIFNEQSGNKLGLRYDPMKTITHVERNSQDMATVDQSARSLHHVQSKAAASEKKLADLEAAPSRTHRQSISSDSEAQSRFSEMPRISFAAAPPQVFPTTEDSLYIEEEKIPEVIEVSDIGEVREIGVIKEEVIEPIEVILNELEEVPEDLTDYRTDGDGESITSIPSSAPYTTDISELEDADEEMTGV